MQHILYRYLIPAFFLLAPVYVSLFVLSRTHELPDGLFGLITATIVPIGYIAYQFFRVYWQVVLGGYETSDFLALVRDNCTIDHDPQQKQIKVDFTNILPKVGERWFSEIEFQRVFDPFHPDVCCVSLPCGYNSYKNRRAREHIHKFYLHFVEHVSDLIMFSQPSYEYTRSISSTRYSLRTSVYSIVVGLIFGVIIQWVGSSHTDTNTLLFSGAAIGVLLLTLAIWLLYLRLHFARAEHNARMMLLTITQIPAREVAHEENINKE